jgi:hypothetical protein
MQPNNPPNAIPPVSEANPRISQLESIAEECDSAADDCGYDLDMLRSSFLIVADFFRSKANTLRKVYRVEEETK